MAPLMAKMLNGPLLSMLIFFEKGDSNNKSKNKKRELAALLALKNDSFRGNTVSLFLIAGRLR